MGRRDLSGVTLGQFQLIRPLGFGGMADVYLARQTNLDRDVAVKVLPPLFAHEAHAQERFRREARTAAGLDHPHIVKIHDFGTDEGISYLAMQLLPGGALLKRLSSGAFAGDLNQVVFVIKQVAAALDYAHKRGVVHRDIKPGNIMFDEHGNCMVVDFGIAKLLQETAALTGTGILGTPAYMAPEQCRQKDITAKADQYALGVVAYEMITSHLPFEAADPLACMYMHLHDEPPLAHTRRPGVPESVSYVLNRALAKSPEARFPSVTDFAQALEDAVVGAVDGTPPPPENQRASETPPPVPDWFDAVSPPPRQPARRRRSRAGVVLSGLLTLIIVVIMAAFGLRIWSLLGSDDGSDQGATDDLIPRLVQTLDAKETATQQTLIAQTRVAAQATGDAIGTQRSREQTATATLWTHTPTPNITASIAVYLTERAAGTEDAIGTQRSSEQTATQQALNAQQTSVAVQVTQAWIDSWTATPTDTPTPTNTPTNTPPTTPTFTVTPMPDPLQMVRTPVVRNTDWTPVPRRFDGVEMVLVPAGCFEMGSDDGNDDEQPVHRVCFEEPFWIDRYEVSQGQFAAFGGQAASASRFTGEDRPVEQITWSEARDFCALRGARLPTEAEWEYAARGPDALVYPWGNAFDGEKAIWDRGVSEGTAPVGSRPGGVSWVGADDLSGNVWEWVADWYDPHYYGTLANGVIDPAGPKAGDFRVLRGGSWLNLTGYLRAPLRFYWVPDLRYNVVGFRCARSAFG